MFRLPVGTQRMQMPLDCEATSLTIALGSVGVHTTQQYVQGHFPTDTRAPVLGADGLPAKWGDPYTDFVGHVMGSEPGSNPHWAAYPGWGAYAPVVARAAESLGVPVAPQLTGWNPAALYAAVEAGHPVLVWTTVDYSSQTARTWTAWDGRTVPWTRGRPRRGAHGREHVCRNTRVQRSADRLVQRHDHGAVRPNLHHLREHGDRHRAHRACRSASRDRAARGCERSSHRPGNIVLRLRDPPRSFPIDAACASRGGRLQLTPLVEPQRRPVSRSLQPPSRRAAIRGWLAPLLSARRRSSPRSVSLLAVLMRRRRRQCAG